MPDLLSSALATPGLGWIVFAAFLAGMVRGFSGFGSAMIFLPIAGQFLPPVTALTLFAVMEVFGPLPMLRRAWKDCNPPDLGRLLLGMIVLLPVGFAILIAVRPEIFRYSVSILSLLLLACLILGVRYRGKVRPAMVYAIGAVSGFLGGAAGIPGPPVILFYMASPLPAKSIRANTTLFLFGFDVVLIGMLALRGYFTVGIFLLGVIVAIPAIVGNALGSAIFRPELERIYRIVAYVIVGVSAFSSLPFFD